MGKVLSNFVKRVKKEQKKERQRFAYQYRDTQPCIITQTLKGNQNLILVDPPKQKPKTECQQYTPLEKINHTPQERIIFNEP